MDIRGAIITIDAMGTQTAIAKQIVDAAQADYVLALEGESRKDCTGSVTAYVEEQMESDFAHGDAARHMSRRQTSGIDAPRHGTDMSIPAPKTPVGHGSDGRAFDDDWGSRCSIIVRGMEKRPVEIRYFISSLPAGSEAVRARCSQSLVDRKQLSLDSRRHLPGR